MGYRVQGLDLVPDAHKLCVTLSRPLTILSPTLVT